MLLPLCAAGGKVGKGARRVKNKRTNLRHNSQKFCTCIATSHMGRGSWQGMAYEAISTGISRH